MLTRDDKAGLYLTVIFHLVILIILLIAQIGFSLQKENSFVIDFTKQEEIEAQGEKTAFRRGSGEESGRPYCGESGPYAGRHVVG